jgi:hypothetical protein
VQANFYAWMFTLTCVHNSVPSSFHLIALEQLHGCSRATTWSDSRGMILLL